MPRPTGPTDPNLIALIKKIRKTQPLLARHLAKSRRAKAAVNVGRLEKVKADTMAVPGKVLSSGKLTRAITVYAWQFSSQAKEKIEKAGGSARPLEKLSGEKVRVVI